MATVGTLPWDEVLAAGLEPAGVQLVHRCEEPPREARYEAFPGDLEPQLASALIGVGICALYEHQAAAWHAARAGEHVCIVTGTASGKSLAFNLPVLARSHRAAGRAGALHLPDQGARAGSGALAERPPRRAAADGLRRRHARRRAHAARRRASRC